MRYFFDSAHRQFLKSLSQSGDLLRSAPRKMLPRYVRIIGLLITALAVNSIAATATQFAAVIRPAVASHCIKCHGRDGKVKGKVDLLKITNEQDLLGKPELIHDLIAVLDAGDMPPESQPDLPPESRAKLVGALKQLLLAAVGEKRSLAHTPIRRMNRFQYNNAVQDLFQLNLDVFALPERMMREHGTYFQPETGKMPATMKVGSRPLGKSQLIGKRLGGVAPFPQDLRAEHGFDNRGDHLTLSPLLLESFLRLSRSILDSHDFNQRTVGIWQEFFAAPPNKADYETEIRTRLKEFLTRAFRRPAANDLVDRYARTVVSRIDSGISFTEAIKGAAAAAICSPRFLYLFDGAGSGTGIEPLNDIELASRLAFFLWGSGPDAALLEVADQGRLHEPAMLEEQVDRMLRDRKLKRFADSFPAQWLQLERIITSVPDREKFPGFFFSKYRLSGHMMMEPLLLFETILVENRSILELIDSDYSYRSEGLSAWYKDQGKTRTRLQPTVVPFRRVAVTNRHEGGVITSAAVMTMTSAATRTQPITRGAWMASVIFNNPPPPPPADVPPLPEGDQDTAHLTIRERLAVHREQPACAGCHNKIDAFGFALENYDATGFWRDKYENGRDVDSSGILFRRHEFSNIIEFKDAILKEKDRFTLAFAKHVMAFALGRETTAADAPALDRIAVQTAADGYHLQTLIKLVVMSEPFRYKSNPKLLTDNAD